MKKNILIVDDSALMRRLLSDIITSDERFIISAIAHNGLEAFDLITLHPKTYDLILLDINMPKMNGIQLLEELKKLKLKQRIIVVSTLAKEGAKETIQCLELGAFDFITKPESLVEAQNDSFCNKILRTMECALFLDTSSEKSKLTKSPDSSVMIPGKKELEHKASIRRPHVTVGKNSKKLVAIACSTGGPKALHEVIPKLPKDLEAPVLIVQHMPEGFTESLAQRLDEMSEIHVKEAKDGELLKNGVVYIAKGGHQMRLIKKKTGYEISISLEAARNGLKPCADIMFESLLESDFDDITCVVLTGMGSDGTLGIKQLNEKNNIFVIAQNAQTCTVYGMPKVLYESGLTDLVVPLGEIAMAIQKNVRC